MCETWRTESVEVFSDSTAKIRRYWIRKRKSFFHAEDCVNLPGVDPMHLRIPRIYRRCAGVDVTILHSKLHCHCNLSPWKTHT